MANIPTDKPIKQFTLDGTEIPLSGGGGETVSGTVNLRLFTLNSGSFFNPNDMTFINIPYKEETNATIPKNSILIVGMADDEPEIVEIYYTEKTGCQSKVFPQYGSASGSGGVIVFYDFSDGFNIYIND